MNSTQISIVTYSGEHAMLDVILRALADQDLPFDDYEVIVADYNNHDDGARIAADFAHAHPDFHIDYHHLPNGTRAKALNAGVRAANSELVVLLADDFIPHDGYLKAHLEFHQMHRGENAVGIGPAFYSDHLMACPFRRWLEYSGTLFGISFRDEQAPLPEDFFYAANTSMKKSFFEASGGFDEDFPFAAWDDYEFSLRLAASDMCAHLVSKGAAWHEHKLTLNERKGAMREAGKSAAILERKHGGLRAWHETTRQSPWFYRVKGQISRCKYWCQHRPSDLDNYYERTLTANFVAAYRNARK